MTPIYFFTHEYTPFRGGVATYVEECALAARRLGYDVQIITSAGGGQKPGAAGQATTEREQGGENGLPVHRLPSSGRLSPWGIATLAFGVLRLRTSMGNAPVVALSAGAHMALIALEKAGCGASWRVLSFFHGSEILKLTQRWPWRLVSAAFYRRHPRLAVASHYVHTLLSESNLCPTNAVIELAPCACAPSLLAAGRAKLAAGSDARSIDPNSRSFCILTVARIHPRKGQLDLARALAELPAELRHRVRFQMVGTGDPAYLREILMVCEEAGVSAEHLGRVSTAQLPALYGACDLFALTSRTLADSVEGFGLVYLEAAAFGCPVVAYATGGVAEAMRDGETGLLVPEGDVGALSLAIAKLMQDPDLCRCLGEAGRDFAQSFSWETSARVLCEAALALPSQPNVFPAKP